MKAVASAARTEWTATNVAYVVISCRLKIVGSDAMVDTGPMRTWRKTGGWEMLVGIVWMVVKAPESEEE